MVLMADWLTIAQAVQESGYSADHLRELVREGKVKGKKVSIVWLVSRSSLSRYLQGQTERGEKRGRKPLTS